MGDKQQSGGPSWFNFSTLSAIIAAIFGSAFLLKTEEAPSGADRKIVVGSQDVQSAADGESVTRIHGPLYDFFGIPPTRDAGSPERKDYSWLRSSTFSADATDTEKRAATKPEDELSAALAHCDLEFMIVTVADPVDSVESYLFDHQIDAVQKAVTADQNNSWLYSGCYFPWQAYRDHRAADGKIALLRQRHWYQDEPGVMLFRRDAANSADPFKLLIIYLVGELPTLGIQRDAFRHAVDDIFRLRMYKANLATPATFDANKIGREIPLETSIDVKIVGPTFSGGAFSLREEVRLRKRRHCLQPRIITGSANSIDRNYFDPGDFGGATICSYEALTEALLTQVDGNVAILTETGTEFGAGASEKALKSVSKTKLSHVSSIIDRMPEFKQLNQGEKLELANKQASKQLSAQDLAATYEGVRERVNERSGWQDARSRQAIERTDDVLVELKRQSDVTLNKINSATRETRSNPICYPFPLGISRVRQSFERRLSEARRMQQPGGLQPLRQTSPLPFEVDETTIDQPSVQSPHMTAPTVEMVLGQIMQSINARGIRNVLIVATDIRDTIFLAEMVRLRCPGAQLMIQEPDILFTHPEYAESLRGSIVASSYPLFPEGIDSRATTDGGFQVPMLSSQTNYGIYNAVLLHLRDLKSTDEAERVYEGKEEEHSWAGFYCDDNLHRAKVWLQVIGNGRYYPLRREKEPTPSYCVSIQQRPHPEKYVGAKESTRESWAVWIALLIAAGWGWGVYGTSCKWRNSPFKLIVCQIALGGAILAVCAAVFFRERIRQGGVTDQYLAYLSEADLFSGLSLTLPLLLSCSAIAVMAAWKMLQVRIADDLTEPDRAFYVRPEWFFWNNFQECFPADGRPWRRLIVGAIAITAPAAVGSLIFSSTSNSLGRNGFFWTTWGVLLGGCVMWSVAAMNIWTMHRILLQRVRTLPERRIDNDVLKSLAKNGVTLHDLLFTGRPAEVDGVSKACAIDKNSPHCKHLTEVQYRMALLGQQFWLVALGGTLLFLAATAFPCFSDCGFQTLTFAMVFTTAVGSLWGYWRLDCNPYLSRCLGTTPGKIDWNSGSTRFLIQNTLVAVAMLLMFFVPGAWSLLGRLFVPLLHLAG